MHDFNFASIPVVFEDENVIILNKPCGLLSIEDGFQPNLPNLRSMLKNEFGNIWAVHRLDKETSGIILFAKNAEAHRYMNSQFSDRRINKTYLAIVQGFPLWNEKKIELPLRVNGDRKHRTIIDSINGKKALTSIELVEKWATFSLFRIVPATGYTHQIRAHCASIGLPIAGDRQYFWGCEIRANKKITRLFLHAQSLEISLSYKDNPHFFSVPLPDEFHDFISGLSDYHA